MILPLKNQKDVGVAKRVVVNTIALLGSRIFEVAISILVVAIVARYLGLSLYGRFVFIVAIVSVIKTLSYFGFQQTLIREIAQNKSKAGLFFGTALIIRGLLSMLVIITVLILAHLLDLSPLEQKGLYFCTLSEIFLSFTMLFNSIFNAHEKMVYDASFTTLNRLSNLILICIVMWLDAGFLFIFVAMALSNFMAMVMTGGFLVFKKHMKPLFRYDPALIKYFIIQSFPLGIGNILRVCSTRVDIFILNIFKSAQDIALFFGSQAIIMRLQVLPISFTQALFPLFSRLAKDSKESLKDPFMRVFRILLSIAILATITIFYMANEIVLLILGPEFVKASLILKILAFAIGFLFLEVLFIQVLVASKKQWLTVTTNGAALLVNLVLDLILIPYYGYVGAAIATSTSYLSRFIVSYAFVNKHVFPLSLREVVPIPLCAGIIASCVIWALGNFNHIVALILGVIVYLSFLWLSNYFKKEEIEAFRNIFVGRFARKKELI